MHINAHLEFDVVALQQDDTVTVMVELEAPPAPAENETTQHVEHAAVVVLDRSGSMAGDRLQAAQRALAQLVDRLDDRDRFGLVVFDHEATVAVPAGKVGEIGKQQLRATIASLSPGGSTDLASGYLRGLQEARRVASGAGATVVLLSDGHANTGIVDPLTFRQLAAKAAGNGITSSTIGIGVGYDQDILAEVATGGSGNHAFAEGPDQAGAAITAEFDGLLSKTVQGANLLISPGDQVTQINVLNDLPGHVVDSAIMTDVGDLYAGESRRVVVAFGVPAMGQLGMVEIAQLTFTYTGLPDLEQHTVTIPVTVNVVPVDVAAGRVPKPEVAREKLFLSSQTQKREAEEAILRGDYDAARQTISESRRRLGEADDILGAPPDPRLQAELDWLAESHDMVGSASPEYLSRRFRSDRTRKSRGYTREQGGEVDDSS